MGSAAARRTGPPPDLNSARSAKRSADWERLPKNVRENSEIPEWPPYITEASMPELAMWNELWKRPQSVFWLRDQSQNTVAMYVRTFISSMAPYSAATEKVTAHRLSDALLLTTPALLAAKVLIVDDEGEIDMDLPRIPGRPSVLGERKSRFTVVTVDPEEEITDENEQSRTD